MVRRTFDGFRPTSGYLNGIAILLPPPPPPSPTIVVLRSVGARQKTVRVPASNRRRSGSRHSAAHDFPSSSSMRYLSIFIVIKPIRSTAAAMTGLSLRKPCGEKECPEYHMCQPHDLQCYPCHSYCNETSHNFDVKICQEQCQGHRPKYPAIAERSILFNEIQSQQ
ncbi:Uncharacterized protein FWK35_00009107 [Aphis craccivora]|uniref:Uncharacterized protein n=1 Tax=Aphis craccivora TaxID=307492 RepID=A0A6G0Z6B3_APHCR|nr:Uncharacterized protein FWK35_00009107 [Aphis craccivora]